MANASDLRGFEDNSFEQIYASHVVEHFDYRDQLVETLKEWYRVLTPTGTLCVSVPDLDVLARLFVDRTLLSVQDRFLVMRMIFGGHVDEHDYHLVGLNEEFLRSYLHAGGFTDVRRVPGFGLFQDTSCLELKSIPISLNMIAIKGDLLEPRRSMTDAMLVRLAERIEQARALHQQGQLAPAREIYQEILEMRPGHFETLNVLGVLSGQLRDLNGAVQYFDQAVAVEPNNSRPYCNRGLALKELGQLDAALSSFDQAIALNRDDAVAWYSRGNLYKERGVADQALACYERALAINPDFAQAHFNRGVLLQQTQQLDVALASYERAVAINPDYAEAYANRGLVLYALNRIDDALLSFDRAIAIKPDYAEVYVNRASVLRTNKRFE